MDLDIPSLENLDSEQFISAYELLSAKLRELLPTADLRRGMLHDINLMSAASIYAAQRTVIDRLWASRDLVEMEADPESFDSDDMDATAALYRVTRREATAASGYVAIILSSDARVSLSEGFEFLSGDISLVVSETTSSTTDEEEVEDGVVLLQELSSSSWVMLVPVEALVAGAAGNLPRNTALSYTSAPSTVTSAYVFEGLSGGSEEETNTSLMSRVLSGIAARSPASGLAIEALVRSALADSDSLIALSVVGFGYEEQQRYHSVFPIAFGGRVDVWTKGDVVPTSSVVVKSATFISSGETGGTWQLSIAKDDAPGFYRIVGIERYDDSPGTAASFSPTVITRGVDLEDLERTPDISDGEEAAFSVYQTAVVQFVDSITDTAGLSAGDTDSYRVYFQSPAQLTDMQAAVDDEDAAPVAGDVLIRGAVPCFVSFSCTVNVPEGEEIDEEAISAALSEAVGRTEFDGTLPAAVLASVVQSYLTAGQTLTGIDMLGKIYRPDGTTRILHSADVLTIPEEQSRLVSPRTAVFFLLPSDVAINVVEV